MNQNKSLSPVLLNERIVSLDVLRGVAVLGILIMNIQVFAMIGAAYMNPMAFGDMTGINKWVWMLSNIFADSKFMAIFSILFGAGMILFIEKALGKGHKAGPLHYRRMFWLLVFGLLHAYLIWFGDILVNYAVCGMIAFLFRKKSNRSLLGWAFIFMLIPSIIYTLFGLSMPHWPPESVEQNMQSWMPSQEIIDQEIMAMRGNWLEQMDTRVGKAIFMETFLFLIYSGWRVLGLMLIGMVLYRRGALTLKRSKQFYTKLIIIGFAVGLPMVIYGIYSDFKYNWDLQHGMFLNMNYNYWGSIGMALAYIGIAMLVCKSGILKIFQGLLAATGRMAFTNYILQSVICSIIFYGTGFGLFGKLDRITQAIIIIPIWIFIIIFSKIWLSYFRFGPLEWLWRSLVYWKVQPMRL